MSSSCTTFHYLVCIVSLAIWTGHCYICSVEDCSIPFTRLLFSGKKFRITIIYTKLLFSFSFINITQIFIEITSNFHTVSHCFPYYLPLSSVSNPLVHILNDIMFVNCALRPQLFQQSSAALLFNDTCEHMQNLSKFCACLQILYWHSLFSVPNPLHYLLPHMKFHGKALLPCYLKPVLSKF